MALMKVCSAEAWIEVISFGHPADRSSEKVRRPKDCDVVALNHLVIGSELRFVLM